MNKPTSFLLSVVLTWMCFEAAAQGPEGSPPPPTPPGVPEVGRPGNEGSSPERDRRPPQVRERVERRDIVREFERPPEGERRRAETGERREAERREVARRLEEARNERRELVEQGKEAEADLVARRIADLVKRWRELSGKRDDARERMGPGERGSEGEGVARRVEERLDHLRRAIEHLHAAGWHGMAERLARVLAEAESRQPRRDARSEGDRGPGGEMRDRGDVQGQIRELRRQVDELRRRLDRQGGDRS